MGMNIISRAHCLITKFRPSLSRLVSRSTLLVGGLLLSAAPVFAIPGVSFKLNVNQNANGAYATAISNLRSTASFVISGNTRMTTSNTSSEQNAGLIALTLTDTDTFVNGPSFRGNPSVTLFLTTDNLYVRGFESTVGTVYQFNEISTHGTPGYNLGLAMSQQGLQNRDVQTLPFGSNYNTMVRVANQGRQSLQFSESSLRNAIFTLAFRDLNSASTDQATARAMMLVIQYFSEGARFYDVYGFAGSSLVQGASMTGLPLWLQYLENSWASISNYMTQALGNENPAPLTVTGINRNNTGGSVTLFSFQQASSLVAVMLNTGRVNEADMGGINGDWDHDEL
jgi:hypothetical protein